MPFLHVIRGTSYLLRNWEPHSWKTNRIIWAYAHSEEAKADDESHLSEECGLGLAIFIQEDDAMSDQGYERHQEDKFLPIHKGQDLAAEGRCEH